MLGTWLGLRLLQSCSHVHAQTTTAQSILQTHDATQIQGTGYPGTFQYGQNKPSSTRAYKSLMRSSERQQLQVNISSVGGFCQAIPVGAGVRCCKHHSLASCSFFEAAGAAVLAVGSLLGAAATPCPATSAYTMRSGTSPFPRNKPLALSETSLRFDNCVAQVVSSERTDC